MEFYHRHLPDSRCERAPRARMALSAAEFVWRQRFMGFNGGPYFSRLGGGSRSLLIAGPAEVDRLLDRLDGAATPTRVADQGSLRPLVADSCRSGSCNSIGDLDPRKVKAVMEAMMTIRELDWPALERPT